MTKLVDYEAESKKAPYDVTLPCATAARAETEASVPAAPRRKPCVYLGDIDGAISQLEEYLALILLPDSTRREDSPVGLPESSLTARLRLIFESLCNLLSRVDL